MEKRNVTRDPEKRAKKEFGSVEMLQEYLHSQRQAAWHYDDSHSRGFEFSNILSRDPL